jgi:hypothetical protein
MSKISNTADVPALPLSLCQETIKRFLLLFSLWCHPPKILSED